jgi:deoxyribonuclease V
MLACVDTHYHDEGARTALVLFENWTDASSKYEVLREQHFPPMDYVPGEFFRRELPSILDIIEGESHRISTLVIDGYVWLDENERRGIGAILYEELGGTIPIVGVAKRQFAGAAGTKIIRESSKNPLIVTSAGIDEAVAARHIASMHGPFRIPTLLKWTDHLARHGKET